MIRTKCEVHGKSTWESYVKQLFGDDHSGLNMGTKAEEESCLIIMSEVVEMAIKQVTVG